MDLAPAHLRAIVTLADLGTFTAAAAELGVAQSSLSRAVAECERRLRTPVFVRTTRRVSLTPEGTEIVNLARRLVGDYEDGLQHLTGYLDGTHGVLRICTLPSLAATLLPGFVLEMRERYPNVRLTIDDALGGQVQEQLSRGQVDVAISARSRERHEVQHEIPLAKDDFYAALRSDHPWASRSNIQWSELSGTPLVAFTGASTIRSLVDDALAHHHVARGDVVTASNVGSVGGLVAAGLGIAAVPGFVLPLLAFADLRYVPLTPTTSRHIVIAFRQGRPMSAPVKAWIQLLLDPGTSRPQLHGVRWAVGAQR